MPYEVIAESTFVLKSRGELTDEDGKVLGYDHESVPHVLGDIIADEDISPVVKALYEDGNPFTVATLKKVGEDDDDPAKHVNKGGRPPKAKPVAEDEADTSEDK